jgi:3-oxoacyl-[acyl-carrier-protein] synthase II
MGPVTAVGIGVDGLRAGLRSARSPVATVTRFDTAPFRSHMAAEIRDFDATDFVDAKTARRTDRFVQFALAASVLALRDAGLTRRGGAAELGVGGSRDAGGSGPQTSAGHGDPNALDPARTAVWLGSSMGGIAHAETQLRAFLERGARGLDPRLATTTFPGAASCQVAIHLGITGPNSTNAMSCAAGTMAVGEGARLVREGLVDVALTGGAEAPLAPVCFGAFAALRAMSQRNDAPHEACRPFDDERDGFVMGEGACVLVLEERSRALARGARIYAEVVGYGTSNDAFHMAAPRPDGAMSALAIGAALRDAGIGASDVEHVNAHASSTPLNDRTESLALRLALGKHTDNVSVTGTKPFHGHALGASGAIEAAITCLTLADGWVPPTLNLSRAGEGCDLAYVTGSGQRGAVDVALCTSFGFGGINAVLALASAGARP